MSDSLPITTPPRRRLDQHPGLPHVFKNITSSSSSSCKNTPNVTRKLDPYHQALIDSGSQSAKSSPLPHRRLDKLEGVIRDGNSINARRKLDDYNMSSSDSSPAVYRKHISTSICNNCNQESPLPSRRQQQLHEAMQRRNTSDCNCTNVVCSHSNQEFSNSPLTMRRRVDSDCGGCSSRNSVTKSNFSKSNNCCCDVANMSKSSECSCKFSPQMHRKNVFSSPAKSVLGEPGCFNSPLHTVSRFNEPQSSANFCNSPAKSVIGEPGVFASPARSLCMSPCDENLDAEVPLQPDQTVVSGWLKFRDNKRVSFKKI